MPAIEEALQQGRYRILHRFEENGAGAVYEAYDNNLETNVVLKEILVKLKKVMTLAQQQTLKLTFASEAKILTEINHESFQRVHDYFSEIDRMYLVMESVDGNCLSELLENDGDSFSLPDVMNWADQLLDALNYLHTQNPPIIYRHIKPQNVKLTSSGKIKLLASGIDGSSETKIDTFVPQTFDTANLHYLPLEQIWERLDTASRNVILNSYDEKSERILKQPADAASDIYALGATVYHLLTGRLPIDALERSIDIMEGKSDPLPAPNQINPAIPPEISDILLKALEIRRENRFDSAVIMRQVLRTAFVRMKEREAEAAAREQNVLLLEVPAEQKMPEQKDTPVEQDKLKAEAEQERQIELIKQQLREAEAQRLLAEQRAAEAEKRLLEKETIDLDEKEFLLEKETLDLSETQSLTLPKFQEDTISAMFPVTIPPDVTESEVIQKNSSDDYKDLFSSVQKESKSRWRMSAVALVLVAFGGAVFGIWFVMTSKSAESNQTIPSQTISISTNNTAAPEPTIEAAPVPIAETTPEISAMPTPSLPADSPDYTETAVKQSLPKNKSLSPSPRAKKQTLPAAKTPAAQKKTVTVDDLINDN